MTQNCTKCGQGLDPVWAEIGETEHLQCRTHVDCEHGDPRGARYCALCRRANPLIRPPVPLPRKRRRAALVG